MTERENDSTTALRTEMGLRRGGGAGLRSVEKHEARTPAPPAYQRFYRPPSYTPKRRVQCQNRRAGGAHGAPAIEAGKAMGVCACVRVV